MATGDFLPQDPLYNMSDAKPGTEEFHEYIRQLERAMFDIALKVNARTSGYYPEFEFLSGMLLFPNPNTTGAAGTSTDYRSVVRIVINTGQLPNATTKTVAHNLSPDGNWSFLNIYGAASDTSGLTYIPLPYAHPTASNNIAIDVDSTNVTITTGIDRTAYDTSYVVLEYVKT